MELSLCRLQESCTAFLAIDCLGKNPGCYTLGYYSPESSARTIYFLTLLATSGTSFMTLFPRQALIS